MGQTDPPEIPPDLAAGHLALATAIVSGFSHPAAMLGVDGRVVVQNGPMDGLLGPDCDLGDQLDAHIPDDPTMHQIPVGSDAQSVRVQTQAIRVDGTTVGYLCQCAGPDAEQADAKAEAKRTQRTKDEFLRLSDKLQLAIEVSGIGIWEFDRAAARVHWDDRMLHIYGITDGKNVREGESWENYLHPDDLDETIAYAEQQLASAEDFKHDYRIIRPDGEIRHIRSIARKTVADGDDEKLIGINMDVTADYQRTAELEHARAQLEYDSHHDALTGLANRRLLDEATVQMVARATNESRAAVLHVDLDHFKRINDTLGHDAGDAVLKHVASSLRQIVRDVGLICRVGGDEFVVLFADAPPLEQLEAMAKTIADAFRLPFLYQGHTCVFGASIGLAEMQGRIERTSELFVRADQALYQAKNAGRSCVRVYSSASQTQMRDRLRVQKHLTKAISDRTITCHYQPQFDAVTHDMIGAEALVRWECPDRGMLLPDAFMPLAEELGLTAQVDQIVLETVMHDQDRWMAAGVSFPRIAVNVSQHRLRDGGFGSFLEKELKPHHNLTSELLESSFLDDLSAVVKTNLDTLRHLGVGIEIDDFGTGHASVVAMQTVRPDGIKIDKRLVLPVVSRPTQLRVLDNLIRIARYEGLRVTLEGVETDAHLLAVQELDCDTLQGFALAQPMPGADFARRLQELQNDRSQSA